MSQKMCKVIEVITPNCVYYFQNKLTSIFTKICTSPAIYLATVIKILEDTCKRGFDIYCKRPRVSYGSKSNFEKPNVRHFHSGDILASMVDA